MKLIIHLSTGGRFASPLPLLEKAFRKHKRPVGSSWRVDETYVLVKGVWKYLYRAVDKAMQANGIPEKVTMDKSGANKSAIDQIIEDEDIAIDVRQIKYLNNIVEQDHRAVKRITRPMLGFKSFHAAASVLAGIELMHMIRKGQMAMPGCERLSFADQFYALAKQIRPA